MATVHGGLSTVDSGLSTRLWTVRRTVRRTLLLCSLIFHENPTPPIGPPRTLEVPNRKLGTSPLWHLRWHPGRPGRCHARCHLTRARSQRPLWPFFSLPAPGVARPTPPPASHPARAHPGPVAALVSSIPLLSYNSTSRLQQKLSPTSRGAETNFHVALREAKSQHCQHSRHSQRPQNYPLYIVTYRRK